ncbi:proteasome-associated ATPase [Arthrobacter sp. Hiyo8]|nr:proteasome-associated ATPase [Arthrobacter sp. Hiyo8]
MVVFFDEMDSLFRTRGTGVSSDVETTIVPQLLSEIDGVERLDNVIVIGASNREDMIDPAILRPGRLDVKVKIQRPDAEAAADIFAKYITTDLPFHATDLAEHGGDVQATVDAIIQRTVEAMYSTEKSNEYLEVTYANGDTEMLYFKDFNSGAVVQNVVDRAKKYAIKDLLLTQQKGLRIDHFLRAVVDEFREHEDMPNTTNPDDWARISGKKGERITYIRTIVQGKAGRSPGSRSKRLPTPASTCDGPAGRPAFGQASRGRAMRVMGSETEYGIHAPSAPGANATMMSARIIQAYANLTRQRAAGGAETRWDYTDEEPLHDARGWTVERSAADPSQLTDRPPVLDAEAVALAYGRQELEADGGDESGSLLMNMVLGNGRACTWTMPIRNIRVRRSRIPGTSSRGTRPATSSPWPRFGKSPRIRICRPSTSTRTTPTTNLCPTVPTKTTSCHGRYLSGTSSAA